MDANEFLKSQFMNAEFVKSNKLMNKAMVITDVKQEGVGKKEEAEAKLVMYFSDSDRGLILNRTNIKIMVEEFGMETEAWKGKVISLLLTKANWQGNLVDSIIINCNIAPRQ